MEKNNFFAEGRMVLADWYATVGFNEPGMFSGFFGGMPVFMKLFFIVFIGIFAFIIIKGIAGWSKNNASPLLTARCRLVAKRSEVWGGSGESSANTSYFATFEAKDGRRIELQVSGADYGMMVEGDVGELSYQGTRFKGFERAQAWSRED